MGVVSSSMSGSRGPGSPSAPKEIAMDRDTLESYLQLERDIARAEVNSPLQPLELKTAELQKLTAEIEEKENLLKELEEKTGKSKGEEGEASPGGGDVKEALLEMRPSIVDDTVTEEQGEHLAALNKQEMTEQELQSSRKQKQQLQEEIKELEQQAEKLQELYKQQDQLLDKMFGGEYGSPLENRLEQELDTLEAHRARVLEANFKWRQAQMMLEYACKQLAVAVQKWQDLPTLPTIDLEIRYSVAADTRNNLVAAGQNLSGAQRYLDSVQFPYCAPEEVATLNKATEYVFTDMQSAERHDHAQACYVTSHKRATALLQWFDTVINTTIMKDLTDINDKVKDKTLELRRERVRLIKTRLKELWGTDVDLDDVIRDEDLDVQSVARAMLSSAGVVKVDGHEQEGSRASTPPLLTDSELAPVPSNSVIFGSMYDNYQEQLDRIAQEHQQELQTFIRDQEQKQQQIRGNLEQKLAARRQRRALKNLEQAQRNALANAEQ